MGPLNNGWRRHSLAEGDAIAKDSLAMATSYFLACTFGRGSVGTGEQMATYPSIGRIAPSSVLNKLLIVDALVCLYLGISGKAPAASRPTNSFQVTSQDFPEHPAPGPTYKPTRVAGIVFLFVRPKCVARYWGTIE